MVELIAVDTETTGLRPWHGDRPFSWAGCTPEGVESFIRFKVDPLTRKVAYTDGNDGRVALGFLKWKLLLEDERVTKVFHNHKFDIRMFEMCGIKVRGRIEDTMFAVHVLRTTETLKLKTLSARYLDISDADEKELHTSTLKGRRLAKKNGWKFATEETHGKKPVYADYWLADPVLEERYNRLDAKRTILLWMLVKEELVREGLWEVYEQEMRLAPITYKMETRGMRVLPEVIEKEIKKNNADVLKYGKEIQRVKPGLDVESYQQLAKYIYEELGVECRHFTDKGNPSVDSEALQELDSTIPIIKTIQLYKASEKANTNFFHKYKFNMAPNSEGLMILHPDFNQIGPVTARYSCRNPNVQNVANALTTRSGVPIQARTPFVPRPGYSWYHFDFSQIEMWIFAALAQETKMLEALFSGRDLHGETAELIWGKGIVAKEALEGKKTSRAKAKMMNFGILFGIGAESLHHLTKTTKAQAQKDLDAYKHTFSGIATFMERLIRKASAQGYIEGPMGRRWAVDPRKAYVAVNYIVQGSAAQVIKKTMVEVDDFLVKSAIDGHLVATIHDEHIDEILHAHANPTVLNKIKRISEDNGSPFKLPRLPVEIDQTLTNWKEKQKFKMQIKGVAWK